MKLIMLTETEFIKIVFGKYIGRTAKAFSVPIIYKRTFNGGKL